MSSARQRYVVTYDIADPQRLRRIFKLMKGFGRHLQLSVFMCELSPMKLALLKAELRLLVETREDQVLLVDVGPAEGRGLQVIESIGLPYVELSREPKVF